MTKQVRFLCPACQQRLAASERKIGQQFKCPKCGSAILVPQGLTLPVIDSSAGDSPVTLRPLSHSNEPLRTSRAAEKIFISRRMVYAQGILIAVVGCLGLWFGMFIANRSAKPIADQPDSASPLAVHFQLMQSNKNESLVPDEGGFALVWPLDPVVAEHDRLPGSHFSADASPSAQELSALTACGGGWARSDEHGNATVTLPQPGNYRVLLVSRHTQRPRNEGPTSAELEVLGKIFREPDKLLADRKYRLTIQLLSNDQKVVNDFGISGK